MFSPAGIVADNEGRILVTDSWLHTILVFDWDGIYQSRIGYRGAEKGHFQKPLGIALGKDDDLYVADCGNHRIQVLSRHGVFLREFGSQGVSAGTFDEPESVSVDPVRGLVAVSERGNTRVQIFDEWGQCLKIIKNLHWARDDMIGHELVVDQSGTVEELGLPVCVCFNAKGLLLVTDSYYHRVVVFDSNWHAVQKFGAGGGWKEVDHWSEPYVSLRRDKKALGFETHAPHGGQGESELNCPLGIAIGKTGRILVADSQNHRVQVFLS